MTPNLKLEAAVEACHREDPTRSSRQIAKLVGCLPSTAYRIVIRLEKQGRIWRSEAARDAGKAAHPPSPPPPNRGVSFDHQANTAESVSERPVTVDELLRKCKVDQARWKVDRYVVNKWEVGAKDKNDQVTVTPLYQIKVWLVEIPGLKQADALREAIDWIRENPPVKAAVKTEQKKLTVVDPHLLVMSIADAHLGKLGYGPETGFRHCDTDITESDYMEAVRTLWARSAAFAATRCLVVLGNDLLNSDNLEGTTTAGTPQSNDGRIHRTFRRAVAVSIAQVEFLRAKCPDGVDVLVVPGNHDELTSFFLGTVLEATYSKAKDVRVFNSPRLRKYYRFGTNLLGFSHGDKEKLAQIPLLMAGEAGQDWAETSHREFFCGHKHTKLEHQFNAGTECGPVMVRHLPSIAGVDSWHAGQGYTMNKRAAEAYLYSLTDGYVGHVSYTVPGQRPNRDLVTRAA